MTTVIAQVTATNTIRNIEMVKVTLSTSTSYAFSNGFRTETFAGTPFVGTATAMGALVAISGHQRDLQVTSYDTTVALAGVDKTKIGQIIDAKLKGAKIEIWRAFYNDNYEMTGDPVLRYTGVVTNFDLSEELGEAIDAFVLSLHCSSNKRVLENKRNGRYTNPNSWDYFASGDTSMDRVPGLNNAKYNFGQKLA